MGFVDGGLRNVTGSGRWGCCFDWGCSWLRGHGRGFGLVKAGARKERRVDTCIAKIPIDDDIERMRLVPRR